MEIDNNLKQKVLAYRPLPEKLNLVHNVPLLFMVGISGAGKNAITKRLLGHYGDQYHEFVTHTTRVPRKNHGVLEQTGLEYHFIDLATADEMLNTHAYIEANVYSNNIYGTSFAEIEATKREGRIGIGDIDVNGVTNFLRLGLDVKPVFILPPDYATWQQRLLKRYAGHEIDQSDWLNRMNTAKKEIEHALAHDYFYFVVNTDLDVAVHTINSIAHSASEYMHRPQEALDAANDILQHINAVLDARADPAK